MIQINPVGDCIAFSKFKNKIYTEGWDYLLLQIQKEDLNAHFSIGVLEGMLTYKQIHSFTKTYIIKD